MSKRLKLLFILFSGLTLPISSCSLVNPSGDNKNIKNTVSPEAEISQLEKEYGQFKTMSLSKPYLEKKLNKWKTEANDEKIIREIEFSRIKHPDLYCAIMTDAANSALKTYIDDKNTNSTGAFLTKKNDSPSFASFLITRGCSTPLLDSFPGTAASYSLRKLRAAYIGSAIRVRRSSDNAEQDIGFVNEALNTAALLAFVGSGNGYVSTWYDQSGSANNAVQATTANQPLIVNTGVVLSRNGKPCMFFDNINDFMTTTNSINLSGANYAIVAQTNASTGTGDYNYIFNSTVSAPQQNIAKWNLGDADAEKYYFYDGIGGHWKNEISNFGQNLFFVQYPTTTPFRRFYVNNTLQSSPITANLGVTSSIYLGKWDSGHYMNGDFQEFNVWTTDQSANRANIQTNINGYYLIY